MRIIIRRMEHDKQQLTGVGGCPKYQGHGHQIGRGPKRGTWALGDVRGASGRQPTLVRTWHERVAGWAPVLIQVQMDQQFMEKEEGASMWAPFSTSRLTLANQMRISCDTVSIFRALSVFFPKKKGSECISLLESRFFLCVRKHTEKYEYRQKNIFLTVYPQKNTHGNITTEKFNCSVCSPSKIIFLWVLHAQKN